MALTNKANDPDMAFVRLGFLKSLSRGLIVTERAYFQKQLEPLIKRNQELEARIEELEARNDFADRGVWKDGMVASKHHGVTHQGSYWIAQRDTAVKPGIDDSWRLAVKRGKDAR